MEELSLSSCRIGIDDSLYSMAGQKLLRFDGFKWLKYADFASLSFDTSWLRAI